MNGEIDRNLRHWSGLSKTDPAQTKQFQRAGGFRGTAIRPVWTEYRLTEHFGPCGVGWGFEKPEFAVVDAGDETLVFCTVAAWYKEDGGRSALIYGVGGDKVVVKRQSGRVTDDEAYKKAFTDALGNAFKHLGASADIHMGLFEDSKYVDEMRKEFGGADDEGEPETRVKPAKANGNGHARAADAKAAGQRIKEALTKADKLSTINSIIELNTKDLELIKEVYPAGYDNLMKLKQTREDEFRLGAD